MTDDEKQIHNERIKLTAGALDRASTGCLIAGFITPTATVGVSLLSSVSTGVWLLAALVLHFSARAILGGMRK